MKFCENLCTLPLGSSTQWHHRFWRSCQLEDVRNKDLLYKTSKIHNSKTDCPILLKFLLLSLLGLLYSMKACECLGCIVWALLYFNKTACFFILSSFNFISQTVLCFLIKMCITHFSKIEWQPNAIGCDQ